MENWKPIKGAGAKFVRYEVSDLGRVRSVKLVNGQDAYFKILTLQKNEERGVYIRLRVGMKSKKFYLTRLVATAFLQNEESKEYVMHINCDTKDNRAVNLRWTDKHPGGFGSRNNTYDIIETNMFKKLACGVKGVNEKMAIEYWHLRISKILDFNRTYGKYEVIGNKIFIGGNEIKAVIV